MNHLVGRSAGGASELCWPECGRSLGLVGVEGPRPLSRSLPGAAGRWGMRTPRERGLPLELVVISDLTQALSEKELED